MVHTDTLLDNAQNKSGRLLTIASVSSKNAPQKSVYDHSNNNTKIGSLTSLTITPFEIQDIIDKNVHSIVDPWVGSIQFPLYKWDKSMASVDSIFQNNPVHIDIATCVNGQDKHTEQLHFCRKTYPPLHQFQKN
mmetsp:Transcript_29922/g.62197  ORF Transcript_29922/g.62197 Transcript_29922/m.62197 type:complete len:134 (-) Transcript_29922:173-574(-)